MISVETKNTELNSGNQKQVTLKGEKEAFAAFSSGDMVKIHFEM